MSQRSYTQQKVIVHSRDASTDSRTSSSSRSSAEEDTSSTSSRTSMTNGSDPGLQLHRVPDNEGGYMTTKTISTSSRRVELHDHQKARYIEGEPRSSNATSEEYKQTQLRKHRK